MFKLPLSLGTCLRVRAAKQENGSRDTRTAESRAEYIGPSPAGALRQTDVGFCRGIAAARMGGPTLSEQVFSQLAWLRRHAQTSG